jgi:putative ABC transport system ATP-binding protein
LNAPLLDARRLYRFYHSGPEEVMALRGVDLHVDAGETVAVVGPSGSGKSTLLACLAGLDEPQGGTVLIAGHRVTRVPEADRAALRARYIGVLFQSVNLIQHLTVGGNVALAQRLTGRPDRGRGAALFDGLGLAARTRAYPSQLSGGEAVRAGLAVALANDPAVLLADEPTGEVDSVTEEAIVSVLVDVAREGRAVVVCTHSEVLAETADRVLRLSDGEVVS